MILFFVGTVSLFSSYFLSNVRWDIDQLSSSFGDVPYRLSNQSRPESPITVFPVLETIWLPSNNEIIWVIIIFITIKSWQITKMDGFRANIRYFRVFSSSSLDECISVITCVILLVIVIVTKYTYIRGPKLSFYFENAAIFIGILY